MEVTIDRERTLSLDVDFSNPNPSLIATYDFKKELWREQSWRTFVVAAVMLLASISDGWALSGPGTTLTMPAFRQFFDWDYNCVLITDMTPLGSTGLCLERYPGAPTWLNSSPCYDCCCDVNPDVDVNLESALVGSLGLGGSAVGAALVAPMTDIIGRNPTCVLASACMIIGASLSGMSQDMTILLLGRVLTGIAIGISVSAGPLFLAELSSANFKGIMANLPQMGLTCGFTIVALYNVIAPTIDFGWRLTFLGCAILRLPALGLIFLPESPRWLIINRGNTPKGKATLRSLRKNDATFNFELHQIIETNAANPYQFIWKPKIIKGVLRAPQNSWRLLSMTSLHVLQQTTGVNAIGFFAPTIFNTFYGPVAVAWCIVFQTALKVVGTIVGMVMLKWFSMKQLLFSTGFAMSLALLAVVLLSLPYNYDGAPSSEWPDGTPPYLTSQAIGNAIILSSSSFYFIFNSAWGGFPYVITAEYLEQSARSIGMSLCGFNAWITSGLLTFIFPYMADPHSGIDLWGTFLFYAIMALVATIYVQTCIMATGEYSIEDVSEHLEHYKVSHPIWSLFGRKYRQQIIKISSMPTERLLLASSDSSDNSQLEKEVDS